MLSRIGFRSLPGGMFLAASCRCQGGRLSGAEGTEQRLAGSIRRGQRAEMNGGQRLVRSSFFLCLPRFFCWVSCEMGEETRGRDKEGRDGGGGGEVSAVSPVLWMGKWVGGVFSVSTYLVSCEQVALPASGKGCCFCAEPPPWNGLNFLQWAS